MNAVRGTFLGILALLFTVSLTFAQAQPVPAGCTQVGTVLNGDTLWECPPAVATATSTPTLPPVATATPSATPPGCCATVFHLPGAGHEHGRQPPDWLTQAGYTPSFTWPGNTPNENSISTKHSAFKGFAGTLNGVQIYVLMHLDTNPGGEASCFHSFQSWEKDAQGGVSSISGWLYFGCKGAQTGPTLARYGCDDTGVRPVMLVNVQSCGSGSLATPAPLAFDTWYGAPAGYLGQAGWYPDLGLSASPTYYAGGVATDPSTWIPTGSLNLTRRLEFSWYANRSTQRGAFFATQFGQIVSGPSDPVCGTPITIAGRTYIQVCLSEFIAPTLTTIQFPNNNFQETYAATGINLPN